MKNFKIFDSIHSEIVSCTQAHLYKDKFYQTDNYLMEYGLYMLSKGLRIKKKVLNHGGYKKFKFYTT